ncbi:MAG TPA: M48 family metalloprotease, partial [Gemmataceae bacterium]|nr:M48 family metalloprotease [Gemmataceae bacterium]
MGKPIFSQLALFCLIILTGCEGLDFLGRKSTTATVPESPFGNQATAASPVRPSFTQAPAAVAVAARVDALGRQILAANSEIGAKPLFNTIGAPHPTLFHKGTSDIYITEGLVKQCATEGQLAALLCHELGAMISEREALAGPFKSADPGPPVEVRVGTDSGGAFGPADQTRLAELG